MLKTPQSFDALILNLLYLIAVYYFFFKKIKMNKFTTIRRSLQTTNKLFEWKPSTHKGVVGLYEFFQGGAENPKPVPTVKEMTTG